MTEGSGPLVPGPYARRRPLDKAAVVVTGGIYKKWVQRNISATLPHAFEQLEISGTMDNFRRLLGESPASFRGLPFQDSDVYKTLEGAAWSLSFGENPVIREWFERTVELVGRVQQPDGYINTNFQRADREQEPWSDLTNGHELYCLGHLLQAGIAAHRSIGDQALLEIGRRFADLVVDRFGGDSPATCGHPEIETAMIELYRETGDSKYLDLAQRFIERRGNGFIGEGMFGPQYYQDDMGVRETRIMRGHAVRALYLNAGVTDLYLETGDTELLDVMKAQWNDMTRYRMYITGGTGSRHRDEAFGDAYELPSERAYAETCAGIALMHWAWRMHLATGEPGYLDEYERCLYNVVSAGVSDDGTHFFYSNPLQRRRDHGASQQESAGNRLPWFSCACCPPNVTRTFSSIDSYLASTSEEDIAVTTYATAQLAFEGVTLEMVTDYPAAGEVSITVTGESSRDLKLRIPQWADISEVRLRRNGIATDIVVESGWVRLEGALTDGNLLQLDLPLEPKLVVGHPEIDAVRGATAVVRGPVVYCAEQRDNISPIDAALFRAGTRILEHDKAELGPVSAALGPRLRSQAYVRVETADNIPLYYEYSNDNPVVGTGEVILRPYASWGNGEPDSMRVWLPVAERHPPTVQ
ncbi:glycoside hydrolase family 127 protein [Nesterenkonia alba]|uniref:glycoside hydrolase family 127 protein n=1 Tax=Nesterenkonia alba TaxID=515814 RepID=UPI0003B69DD3|nr:beta-L-arabinofuranosidase domain-containing protein [Nesterenkonia alba]